MKIYLLTVNYFEFEESIFLDHVPTAEEVEAWTRRIFKVDPRRSRLSEWKTYGPFENPAFQFWVTPIEVVTGTLK